MGYKSYRAKKKPLRTHGHKKQRLLFAHEHQYWCYEWNNIIWSGEAHFELPNRKNCTFVRRLRSENDQPYQLVRNFQLRAELIKITSFERAQKTEQEYQNFSKTYAQVPSKIFLK